MNREQLRDYFVRKLKWGTSYQSSLKFDFLCSAADAARGGVILDAGSGYQPYRPFFDECIYIGQDHPVAGVQNKKIVSYDVLCDVRYIPFEDDSVDVILSTSSLEHMEFPQAFFSESFRVLKPGGAVYINAPFAYPEHEAPYDFQRLTRYGMRREYEHAGFERVSVAPTSSSLYAGQYFFISGIKEDGKRMGRTLKAKIIWKPLLFLARCLCKVASWALDRGPKEDTKLPIGWNAIGYKPGAKVPGPNYASAADFITQRARCDDSLEVRDGCIVPKTSPL